jgi:hypothetical protein
MNITAEGRAQVKEQAFLNRARTMLEMGTSSGTKSIPKLVPTMIVLTLCGVAGSNVTQDQVNAFLDEHSDEVYAVLGDIRFKGRIAQEEEE